MRQREADQGWLTVLVLGGALCVGAVILIVRIVGASDVTGTVRTVLYTTLALTIFGACAAAGLHLAERRPMLAPLGYLTTTVALLGFAAIAVKVIDEGVSLLGDWHLQGVGLALTLTLAQAAIVLAYDRREDPLVLRLSSAGTIVSILAIGVLGALAAANRGLLVSEQVFGVLATLYLLGAALTTLFRLAEWGRRRGHLDSASSRDAL